MWLKEIQIDDDEDLEIRLPTSVQSITPGSPSPRDYSRSGDHCPHRQLVAFFACVPLALYLGRDLPYAPDSSKEQHRLNFAVLFAVNQVLPVQALYPGRRDF